MSTDIWIHLEHRSRKTDKYVYDFEVDGSRIYALFGALAGARGDLNPPYPPRGLPDDITPETFNGYESFGDDAHTSSWLSTKEFRKCLDLTIDAYAKEHGQKSVMSWLKTYEWIYEYMKYSEDVGEPSRIVFWFDN